MECLWEIVVAVVVATPGGDSEGLDEAAGWMRPSATWTKRAQSKATQNCAAGRLCRTRLRRSGRHRWRRPITSQSFTEFQLITTSILPPHPFSMHICDPRPPTSIPRHQNRLQVTPMTPVTNSEISYTSITPLSPLTAPSYLHPLHHIPPARENSNSK